MIKAILVTYLILANGSTTSGHDMGYYPKLMPSIELCEQLRRQNQFTLRPPTGVLVIGQVCVPVKTSNN